MRTLFTTKRISQAVAFALLSTGLATSQVAFAQDADAEEEIDGIEHIEVTSRNRKETLDKIPISVLSYSLKDIEQAGLEDINDIAANAIGFSMEKTFGRQADIPVIRGVSWIPGFGSQKASYFIDGVFFSGSIQSLPLDLIERVEVVKGPQSALYGRRTFSGAINYITRRPTDELSGYGKVTLGQNGKQEFSVGVSKKLNDFFAFRASYTYDDYDSEFENTQPNGPEVGGENSKSAMLGLYLTPSKYTDISLNYIWNKNDDEHTVFQFQPGSENNCFLDTRAYYCGEAQRNLPVSVGGVLEKDEYGLRTEREHLSFKLNHYFDFGTLTWISGFNSYESENGIDQTYAGYEQAFSFGFFSGGPFLGPATAWHTLDRGASDEYSHEIRFSSEALDDRLLWSVGAYVWHEEDDPENSDSFVSERDNTAIMGMVSYDFTDEFRLSVEARRSEDEVSTQAYDTLINTPGFENISNEFTSTTTRAIAEYDINSDTLAYFTRAEGNSPGNFNTNSLLPAELVVVEEEEMVMYELGLKSTILDGSLYYSAAIYTMDWDKQQLTDSFQPPGDELPVSYTSNAGETEIKGLEIQGKWMINDNVDIDFGWSRTDAEFVELYDSNQCRLFAPGGSSAFCSDPSNLREFGDVAGNTPPQVPKNEVLLAVNFNAPMSDDWEVFGRMDYSYDSTRYAHIHNLIETGSKKTVNVRLGAQYKDWRVTAFVRNLTDDDTPTYVFRYIDAQSFAFSSRAFPIAPRRGREFGVTATYTF